MEASEKNCPIIYGDFTNWKPKKMTEIVEFAETFESKFDEEVIFEKMQADKVIKSSQYEYNDLN